MTYQQIQAEILKLPSSELMGLIDVINQRINALEDEWDAKLAADEKSGKFNGLFEQIDSAFEAGHIKPL
jgi:hypothetical protein